MRVVAWAVDCLHDDVTTYRIANLVRVQWLGRNHGHQIGVDNNESLNDMQDILQRRGKKIILSYQYPPYQEPHCSLIPDGLMWNLRIQYYVYKK